MNTANTTNASSSSTNRKSRSAVLAATSVSNATNMNQTDVSSFMAAGRGSMTANNDDRKRMDSAFNEKGDDEIDSLKKQRGHKKAQVMILFDRRFQRIVLTFIAAIILGCIGFYVCSFYFVSTTKDVNEFDTRSAKYSRVTNLPPSLSAMEKARQFKTKYQGIEKPLILRKQQPPLERIPFDGMMTKKTRQKATIPSKLSSSKTDMNQNNSNNKEHTSLISLLSFNMESNYAFGNMPQVRIQSDGSSYPHQCRIDDANSFEKAEVMISELLCEHTCRPLIDLSDWIDIDEATTGASISSLLRLPLVKALQASTNNNSNNNSNSVNIDGYNVPNCGSMTTKEGVFDSSDNIGGVLLTRRGYKGGPVTEQRNQDRVALISPFLPNSRATGTHGKNNADTFSGFYIGLFDGHGEYGHAVAQHVSDTLPHKLYYSLLRELQETTGKATHTLSVEEIIQKAYRETDASMSQNGKGRHSGTTAISVFQFGKSNEKEKNPFNPNVLYIANVGDSTIILINSLTGDVLYRNKPHKPHLPEESKRIKEMGGEVIEPPWFNPQATSRVLKKRSGIEGDIHDLEPGVGLALAMSRSIGDLFLGEVAGVIPDPTVDVLDISEYQQQVRTNDSSNGKNHDNGSFLFVVLATDGLLDFVPAEEVAMALSHTISNKSNSATNTASSYIELTKTCEKLIQKASNLWKIETNNYRDDITMAVHPVFME